MGGRLPPISFWTPCLGPPGPAANHCRPPGRNTAHWLIIGRTSCVKLAGLTHDASGLWWEILHPQPIPRSAVPRSRRLISARRFLPQENESLGLVSFRLWCFGYNQTRDVRTTIALHRGRGQEKGPLQAKRPREIIRCESGVRSPPLKSQLCTRRYPDAGPSDHDIDRLKIPLDIGSPPLCCCCC
jgi:hypothetical protein